MTPAGPLIAHRGASLTHPENTLAAIRAAHGAGCRWAEIDVQVTADGAAVLMHDHTVDRTTTGRGPVAMLRGAQIAALATRDPRTGAPVGEAPPELGGVLALCAELGLGLVLEIKATWGVDDEDAARVAAMLPAEPGFPLLVTSFSVPALQTMRRHRPDLPLGLACLRPPRRPDETARRLGLTAIHCNAEYTTAADIGRMRAAGLHVAIATVNVRDAAERLLAAGAHGIMTDDPALLTQGASAPGG